jgi:hypothetical protein
MRNWKRESVGNRKIRQVGKHAGRSGHSRFEASELRIFQADSIGETDGFELGVSGVGTIIQCFSSLI